MAKKIVGPAVLVLLFLSISLACAQDFSAVPEKGTVTMVDLGAKKCIPCKMMAPIMEKLEKAYEGKAHIVFIDVWKNRGQAPRFGIRTIPTQIFFNENGEEVWRHEGFLEEKTIVDRLTEMGVKKPDIVNNGVSSCLIPYS
ncbi:thioredoxin [Desulfobacter hydrogenophilus]|uniref:Thioredoxin n=1 Tax=Desulfobacter hydrogenophilus TaxID=2291 RepID=A0A328F9U7_9BACT|nr:thioredoxin family protein [Desulfobacter hydrogenophilus]NDY74594.1 thioredoxin family protein [Desulfobacter hydrogenophilus]QBH14909.1 thioredoxin [Desulfobacter hydrogenophilus]RAL99852.1 thioredoxin [Desulfobacter hydrogenophilus]